MVTTLFAVQTKGQVLGMFVADTRFTRKTVLLGFVAAPTLCTKSAWLRRRAIENSWLTIVLAVVFCQLLSKVEQEISAANGRICSRFELRSSGRSPVGKGDKWSPESSTVTFRRFRRGSIFMSSTFESEKSLSARTCWYHFIFSSWVFTVRPTVIQFRDEFCCADGRVSPTTHFVWMRNPLSRRNFRI